jgi:NADH-quinone oxidoreductase subunit F
MPKYEPVLLKSILTPGYTGDLAAYERAGGYQAIRKVLKEHQPDQVIEIVKKSGLRGRGGAGFPTGTKWGFIPKDPSVPKYLCVNADESEPGTFKDRELIERDPHQMIEGTLIAAYAIGAKVAYIYIRGEFALGAEVLERALNEARAKGYVGTNVCGSGREIQVWLHRGAGAYICGEETALIESIEGKRGLPRAKPPFPAINGLYQKPTVVNNVETLANLPHIVNRGPEWFASIGTPKSAGMRIFCVSGHVKRPGNYEVPMGIPLRELIDEHAGGVRDGHRIKDRPEARRFTPDHLDDARFRGRRRRLDAWVRRRDGDETTCMVWAAYNLMGFFHHESCGKCTPCREGSGWLHTILGRIEHGEGRPEDLGQLEHLCGNIAGKTVCAFGDAEVAPVLSTLKHFRDEYEAHIREKRCPMGERVLAHAGR